MYVWNKKKQFPLISLSLVFVTTTNLRYNVYNYFMIDILLNR